MPAHAHALPLDAVTEQAIDWLVRLDRWDGLGHRDARVGEDAARG